MSRSAICRISLGLWGPLFLALLPLFRMLILMDSMPGCSCSLASGQGPQGEVPLGFWKSEWEELVWHVGTGFVSTAHDSTGVCSPSRAFPVCVKHLVYQGEFSQWGNASQPYSVLHYSPTQIDPRRQWQGETPWVALWTIHLCLTL